MKSASDSKKQNSRRSGHKSIKIPFSYEYTQSTNYIGAVIFHFLYSFTGLAVGIACIGGGVLLFINGISGNVSWTAKLLEVESQISDAAPGVILFVAGIFIVYITRFKLPTFDPTDEMKEVTKQISQTTQDTAQIVKDTVTALKETETTKGVTQ